MKRLSVCLTVLAITSPLFAGSTTIAEDDASASAYTSGWTNGSNGGRGFGNWTLTSEGNANDRHSGFYIANTSSNPDLNGIYRNEKAFGLYANGSGFEQAVAYRNFSKSLQAGDSFSFMMENGLFERKFDQDDPTPGSIGLALRHGNASESVADYNRDEVFEFGFDQGKANFQIYDGTENSDSGVAFSDFGVAVKVTITGPGTYDLEIETLSDKKVTKLPGRKLKNSGSIDSFAVFDRNGEKNDAYFDQFQVTHTAK